jgi:hypothetical protein
MEWAVGILSTLIGLAGTPGIVLDRLATDFVRSQVHSADVLMVRIENTPNYQIVQGDVDRILVAGRGVYIQPFLRVDTIDVETDPISVSSGLSGENFTLKKSLQAAVRVIITSDDVNLALRSPTINGSFRNVEVNFTSDPAQAERFDLTDPRVDFLDGDRIRLTAVLVPSEINPADHSFSTSQTEPTEQANELISPILIESKEYNASGDRPQLSQSAQAQAKPENSPNNDEDKLEVLIEASLRVENGVRLQIVDPVVNLQGVAVPKNITDAFVDGLNKILDLRQLEEAGIIARVLQFKVTDGQMQVVGFAQVKPEAFQ